MRYIRNLIEMVILFPEMGRMDTGLISRSGSRILHIPQCVCVHMRVHVCLCACMCMCMRECMFVFEPCGYYLSKNNKKRTGMCLVLETRKNLAVSGMRLRMQNMKMESGEKCHERCRNCHMEGQPTSVPKRQVRKRKRQTKAQNPQLVPSNPVEGWIPPKDQG